MADQRYKLYDDGTFVDILDSPLAEKSIDESDAQAIVAKQRLQEALGQLRAGHPATRARPGRPPLRAEAAPDVKADLRVLVENKIITEDDAWTAWGANASAGGKGPTDVAGPQVAELLIAAARHFGPAAEMEEAVEVLVQQGIILGAGYWKQNAVAGGSCSGANVARLINKIAQRLRTD